jgi:hypothetical protein
MMTHKWSVYEAIGLPDQSIPARRWADLASEHGVSLPENFDHGYSKAAEAMAGPHSVTLPRRTWINLYAFSPARWCLPSAINRMVSPDADRSVFYFLVASAGVPALTGYWAMVEEQGGGKALSSSWWDKDWSEFMDLLKRFSNDRRRKSELACMSAEEALIAQEMPSR